MADKRTATPENSGFIIYIRLEPYLIQWVSHAFNSYPVMFPKNSTENDIIELGLTTKPQGYRQSEPGEDMLPIALPFFKYKDVRSKNFLPNHGKNALRQCIRTRFVIQLWSDLFRFGYIGKMKQDILWSWMEANGIELTETNWSTIAKIYDRRRKAYNLKTWRDRIKKRNLVKKG